MIERGDVVAAQRRVGFGATGQEERFVVLQDEGLLEDLATWIVVPLEPWAPRDAADALSVRITKREAGTTADQAARIPLLGARAKDRFGVHPVGRLTAETLGVLDETARRVMGL